MTERENALKRRCKHIMRVVHGPSHSIRSPNPIGAAWRNAAVWSQPTTIAKSSLGRGSD